MRHKIDLYAAYRRSNKKDSKVGFGTTFILYVLLLVLGVGGFYTFEKIQMSKLTSDKNKYNAFVLDATNIKSYKEILDMRDKLNLQNEYEAKVISVSDILGDKRKIYSYVINAIEAAQPQNVDVTSISINRGKVSLNFTSSTPLGPSILATNLKRNASFEEVTYNGYSRNAGSDNSELVNNLGDDPDSVIITAESFTGTIDIILSGGF